MWRKRDSVLVDLYKNHSREDPALRSNRYSGNFYNSNCISQTLTKSAKDPSSIYAGSDFDVFGKEQSPQPFAALYSIEPFIPKQPKENKEEIVITQRFKRGQMEALLDSTAIIKKRKVKEVTIHGPQGIFYKPTAPYNTPSNIFMTHNNEHWEDSIDLEYC